VSALLAAVASPPLDPSAERSAHPASAAGSLTVRTVLAGYGRTLLVPLLVLVGVLAGWTLTTASGWTAAAAAVAGWSGAVAVWLRRRGWHPLRVHVVTWAGPAVLLAPLAAGWLTADGLVLWAPVTTVLAVCLALTDHPLPAARRTGHSSEPASTPGFRYRQRGQDWARWVS
jgi:hypothetical protein